MGDGLPLSSMLSRALVAFTIEFDNEFEHLMPHRTTNHGSSATSRHAPWLVSMAMWSNCMRFVGEEGIRVGELERVAHTTTNLAGMQRWGYVGVAPDAGDGRGTLPQSERVIRATRAGRKAQQVWRPLAGEIEARWRDRFGAAQIDRLREALWAVADQFETELPDCLPILGYGLFSKAPQPAGRTPTGAGAPAGLPVSALLSRVLVAFVVQYEEASELSLATAADVVAVLDRSGVALADLPRLGGVSKESVSMALGVLEKARLVEVELDPAGGRVRIVRLTEAGQAAQDAHHQLLGRIENGWRERFGADRIRELRASLEPLVVSPAATGAPGAAASPLFRGLEPYPDGWRAAVRRPERLPDHPMVLHRGGFPDGS